MRPNWYETESVNEGYIKILQDLLQYGERTAPRGLATIELKPIVWRITNPRKRTVQAIGRWENLGFSLAELLWIMCGDNRVEPVAYFTPQIKQFSDDGKVFNAPYGERIRAFPNKLWEKHNRWLQEGFKDGEYTDQLMSCYRKLRDDKDSRQAVMSLWNPCIDGTQETRDIPCTNWFHFTIRNGKLDLTVVMRGNDIILGTPYNLFNFMTIQEILAGWLDVDLGTYTHIVDCFHVYEHDLPIIARILGSLQNQVDVYSFVPTLDARENHNLEDATQTMIYQAYCKYLLRDKISSFGKISECTNNKYWKNYVLAIQAKAYIKKVELNKAAKVLKKMDMCDFKLSIIRNLWRQGICEEHLLDGVNSPFLRNFLMEDCAVVNSRAESWLGKPIPRKSKRK